MALFPAPGTLPSYIFSNNVSLQDAGAAPIVMFHLTLTKTTIADPPLIQISNQSPTITPIPATPASQRSWKIQIPSCIGVERPFCLLTFGSIALTENVLMSPCFAPIQLRIYAQLNSGPDVYVLEDSSEHGTWYHDGSVHDIGEASLVHHGRIAVRGLQTLKTGPYIFRIYPSGSTTEATKRHEWFRRHQPILVSPCMLVEQLRGVAPSWLRLRQIARGGFGVISEVMEGSTGLMLAMKEQDYTLGGTSGERRKETISKEWATVRQLTHPHLVEFITATSLASPEGIQTAFLMPLFRSSLQQILHRMDLDVKKRAMLQVVLGLEYMHGRGFIHRDIKPENIFVSENPLKAVLGDMGLTTGPGEWCGPRGTEGYMAPEAHYWSGPYPAIDIFALGMTFFEILEFERARSMDITQWVSEIRSVPPTTFPKMITKMTEPIAVLRPSIVEIRRCIERNTDMSDNDQHPHASQVQRIADQSGSLQVTIPSARNREPDLGRRMILAPIPENATPQRLDGDNPARATAQTTAGANDNLSIANGDKTDGPELPAASVMTSPGPASTAASVVASKATSGAKTSFKSVSRVDFTRPVRVSPNNLFAILAINPNFQDQRVQQSHLHSTIGGKSTAVAGSSRPLRGSVRRSSLILLQPKSGSHRVAKASAGALSQITLQRSNLNHYEKLGYGARELRKVAKQIAQSPKIITIGLYMIVESIIGITWDKLGSYKDKITPRQQREALVQA